MREAILARHGETTYNLRQIVNGDLAVDCPLTGRGEEQARRLGRQLGEEPIGLCVTSEFDRTRQTADLALDGRDVPRLVLPELNDPRYGGFEGGSLERYRYWASSASSRAVPTGEGESRLAIVERYVRGFRVVLGRAEETVLVVCHSLPIAYLLDAVDGAAPGRRVPLVDYAYPYRIGAEGLRRAVEVLESWAGAPTW
jgi:broad specificity phosphatase PhoE